MFIIAFFGCSPSKKYYKIAIEELEYIDKKENFTHVKRKELKLHTPLIFLKDTIDLELESITFGLRNLSKNSIYIYTFNKSNIHRIIECDTNWNVRNISLSAQAY